MTEAKYSTHIYDLSIKRVDTPVNLGGGSISVIAVKGDCFIKLNDKSQDPINLLHTATIKTEFTKFYLSNNVQVGGFVAIIVGKHCEFELTTNVTQAAHGPLLFPKQIIPEHLLGRVIDTPEIINVWNIENAVFKHKIGVSSQTGSLRGIFISPDGLKLYIIGRTIVNPTTRFNRIHEYNLSKSWDISTATFRHSLDISTQTTSPTGLTFNPGGSAMFCIDKTTRTILKYTLATSWDITTATFNTSFLISTSVNLPFDLYITSDGHKMYIIDAHIDTVIEFNLNIAWDITTIISQQSLNITHHMDDPRTLFLSPDGLCLYVTGRAPQKILAFRLLKAWDISTAILHQSFDYNLIMEHPVGIFFKSDGTKMYKGESVNNRIYEFDL
jgi:DNA-binding beta-propeller fold protein YncE